MKEQAEWNTQEKVDEAADAEMAARNCAIGDVKGYWIAKRLGTSPGGGLYKMVEDWKARREKGNAGSDPQVFFPPEGEAELSALLNHLKADILTGVARVYCEHFSGVERAAAARDADKERKLRGAQDELRSVLDHWENAEEDRDLALAEIDDLQVILLERDHQIARLEGRIEQLTLELRTAQQDRDGEEIHPNKDAADEAAPIPDGLHDVADEFEARFLDDNEDAVPRERELERDGQLEPPPRSTSASGERKIDNSENAPLSRGDGDDQQVVHPDGTTKPEPGESGSSGIGENGNA